MKFGTRRVKALKEFFFIYLFMLTLVVAVPDIVNYFVEWRQPVTDKESLLRLLWIIPPVSFIGAIITALLTKEDDGR